MEEKKKKSKLKWIIIVIVAIAIIAAVAGGGSDDSVHQVKTDSKDSKVTNDNSKKEEKETEAKTSFKVGETAEYKDVQVTLEKVIISKGDEIIQPDEGKEFAICIFKIQNNSDSSITMSSIASFEAYYDDTSMNEDIMGLQAPEAKKYNQLDGDIATGKKMEGVIAYQVPTDWKEIEINVSPSFWSSKDIQFIATNK